jgi:hypothetical protein
MAPRKMKTATGAARGKNRAVTIMRHDQDSKEVVPSPLIRQSCALCGLRKLEAEYPISENGSSILVTCNECLRNVDAGSQQTLLEGIEATGRSKRKRESTTRRLPVKKAKKTREPPAETAECRVCADIKHRDDFPKPTKKPKSSLNPFSRPVEPKVLDIPASCASHLCIRKANKAGPICKECIGKSLAGSLSYKSANDVGCPDEKCGQAWDTTDYVVHYLSTEDFTTFSDKLFDTYIKTNKRMYLCKNSSCQGGGIVDMYASANKGFPNMECPECKMRQCFNCGVPWHANQTCQEYQLEHQKRSKEEEESLKSLAKEGARRCTHCAYAVIKIDGCPNMHCEWLWIGR